MPFPGWQRWKRGRATRNAADGIDVRFHSAILWLVLALMGSLPGCGNSEPKATTPQTKSATNPPAEDAEDQPIKRRKPAQPRAVEQEAASVEQDPATATQQDDKQLAKKLTQLILRRASYPVRPLNGEELAKHGIKIISAQPMRLVTDADQDIYAPVLLTVDPLLQALEAYFGKLPPSEDGSPFHLTAFLMASRDKFADARLMPAGELLQFHGRQMGSEFWMNSQTLPYYQAHLFAHEATHAFMMHLPGATDDLPVWYLEGMAELFGTHERDADQKLQFGVMPTSPDQLRGWERIALVRRDIAARGLRSVNDILSLKSDDYVAVESYAWSWALCRFLVSHPIYRDRFQKLGRNLTDGDFGKRFTSTFGPELKTLNVEWKLFANQLVYGFDIERSTISFKQAAPLTDGNSKPQISASLGWQDTGIRVNARQTYHVVCQGQVTLATTSKPWLSEANGISIQYANGQPLGRLIACVRSDETTPEQMRATITEYPLGNSSSFAPQATGSLMLRVNDDWSKLVDNSGDFIVQVSTE